MKLSKLTLQGFTCFKERTSIDFSNLQLFGFVEILEVEKVL